MHRGTEWDSLCVSKKVANNKDKDIVGMRKFVTAGGKKQLNHYFMALF